jgi:hypothetical protein
LKARYFIESESIEKYKEKSNVDIWESSGNGGMLML